VNVVTQTLCCLVLSLLLFLLLQPKGHSIACGSYTGSIFLWSLKGVLLHSLRQAHTGPVTCVSFNKSGTLVLSGSVDHTLALWDVEQGTLVQRWHVHSGPVLDVQWCPVFVSASQSKNKDSVALQSTHPDNAFIFASCSTDGNIYVIDVRHDPKQQQQQTQDSDAAAAAAAPSAASLAAGSGAAPRLLSGHEGEVNCLSWDPTGTLLLSGSDDGTAKIWAAFSGDIVHDLVDHARGVLVASWSGTGACTDFHKYPLFVATGSLDTTVRLWDPATGACLHTLAQHTHPVSLLAFAPRQQLLATASHERVFLWSLTSGALLRTFKNLGDPLQALPNHVPLGQVGGLLALKFDNKGEQLAISYADGMTYVLDLTNKQQWEEQARAGQ
jgi:transducin (beta)-like 1